MLRERLATVSKEQEEGGATVRDARHMPCERRQVSPHAPL